MKKEGYWKYRETNPTTGIKYYDWVNGKKPDISQNNSKEPPEAASFDQTLLTQEEYMLKRAAEKTPGDVPQKGAKDN